VPGITVHCFKKNGHPFCFCHNNFVSHDHILVILGSLVAKEICNRTRLTDLKKLQAHYVKSRTLGIARYQTTLKV